MDLRILKRIKAKINEDIESENRRPTEFTVFYWLELVQLFCLTCLYWVASINLKK